MFDELNGIMIKFGEADQLFLTLLLKYIISNRIWRLRKTLELEYLYELYQSDKLMKCEKKTGGHTLRELVYLHSPQLAALLNFVNRLTKYQ